jgi:GNAT superfamily N-acetyltransferase
MVQVTTRVRVDAFWSKTLGVEAADLHTPGVRVLPNPKEREAWRGIYVLAFEGVNVFAPADLVDWVRSAIHGQEPEALLEAKTWHEAMGDGLRSAWGPVLHYYLDSRDGLDAVAAGRRINPRDADALAGLRGAVNPMEWLVTGFTAQTAMLFGLFEDGRMVAAANLTPGPDAATDVGFVLHPSARGKGYGLQIAATAARQAILMHGVARFRALTTSPSTMAIADRLGFAGYGRNLAAYLSDTPDIVMA